MALHEESLVDERFGHVINHDFAEYYIPTNADMGEINVAWIDEEDPHQGMSLPLLIRRLGLAEAEGEERPRRGCGRLRRSSQGSMNSRTRGSGAGGHDHPDARSLLVPSPARRRPPQRANRER
jgi:hypothetical protein